MISPIISALTGMNSATNRFEGAASRIIERPTRGNQFKSETTSEAKKEQNGPSAPGGPVPGGQAPGGLSGGTGIASPSGPSSKAVSAMHAYYTPSLAEDIAVTKQSLHAYKANAKLLKTVDSLLQTLIAQDNSKVGSR